MPDYNLGRAHGRVEITADTDQAQRALGDYEGAVRGAQRATSDLDRVEQERSRRAGELESAARRRKDAEAEYTRVMKDATSSVEQQVDVEERRNRARGEHLQAARRAADAERAYQAAVQGNTDAVRKFIGALDDVGPAHDRASRKVRDFRNEVNETERTVRVLSRSITSILAPALKALAISGAVGIGGGALGLLGAGGLQSLVVGIGGVVAAITELSGAVALLPGLLGGAVTVLGTLAIAFHGVGDALSAAMEGDPKKFAEAIKDMGPATRSVINELAQFTQSFKGAMAAVQDSFFRPLIGVIAPLVQQWLPALMQAGQQVANVLGEAGRVVANWLGQASTMQGFQEFISNLVQALQRMLPAIQPIADAFLTLTRVGSQFFPQIADSIVRIANAFNNWVQGAAQSGQLQAWISGALTAFGNLFDIIKNVGVALGNIGSLANAGGGGFLEWLVRITDQFRQWTESAEGAATITSFFQTLRQAGEVLSPILRIIGGALGQLLIDMVNLGINMGPGLTTFFQSLSDSLGVLGQVLIQSGPAFNQILTSLGQILLQVVQQIGPQLPGLFKDLADVLIDLAPSIAILAGALADLLSHLTPTEIETILALVVAFQGLTTVIPLVVAAISGLTVIGAALGLELGATILVVGGVVIAIGLLVAALIYVITHWDQVKSVVKGVWEDLKAFGSWLASEFMERVHAIGQWFTDVWTNIRDGFTNIISEAMSWGVNLVQSFINGLIDAIPGLRQTVDFIAGIIPASWKTKSPAKRGPLAETSPDEMGSRLVSNFASGIESGSPQVGRAASGAAGAAAGGFSGADVRSNPNFGGGKSGFNTSVAQLVQDLQAFSSIIKNSFGLFQKVADIFVNATKITASLWNQGNNPMTRRGGIFSELPGLLPEQQLIPGVEQMQEPGKAPLPELTPQGNLPPGTDTPVVPQTPVGGVPPAPGAPPPGPGSKPPPAAPAGATTVPITQRPDGTWTSPNPAWAHLLERESSGNPTIVNTDPSDPNAGPNASQGLFQFTPDTWHRLGYSGDPRDATPQQQAEAAAKLITQNPSGSDWGAGRPGRENAAALRAGLIPVGAPPGAPPPNAPPPTPAGGVPPQDVAQYNYRELIGATWQAGKGWVRPDGSVAKPRVAPGPAGVPPLPQPGEPSILPDTNLYPTRATSPKPAVLPNVEGTAGYGPSRQIPGGGLPGAQAERRGVSRGAPFQSVPYGLPHGTNTGGYGNPEANKIFPQWVLDLGAQYGVKPSTYPDHQESDRGGEAGYAPNPQGLNRGIDWVGTPQQMEAFAQALLAYGVAEGQAGGLEQIIYQAASGKQYGLGGAGADVSGRYYPQTGEGSYAEHATSPSGQGGHVHTRFSTSVPINLTAGPAAAPRPAAPPAPPPAAPTPSGRPPATTPSAVPGGTPDDDWMNVPGGWDITQPIPLEIRHQHGIPDDVPPIFYNAQPGTVTNVVAPPDYTGPTPVSPGGTISVPLPGATGAGQPGFPGTAQQNLPFGATTPMGAFQSGMSAVSSVAGDAMAVFDNIIKSIGATANIMDMLVRGPSSTEDIMSLIDNFQQYITTAASVAKLVGSIGGMIGGAGAGDPTGMAGAVGGGIQAIAGMVQAALEATNMAIDLGQEIWHQASKYAAIAIGHMLGGDIGFLGGNVRMLLNTATGEIQAYSEDNPENKAIHRMPDWVARSYGGTRPETQPPRLAQVNIFAGPGQSPQAMMSESMWLASNSGSAATIAAVD